MNDLSHALSVSLARARLSATATLPLQEQDVLARLHAAAGALGYDVADVMTTLFVGIKLHLRMALYGPARDHSMTLLETLAATMVGPDSDQVLHVHGPPGQTEMLQRYAAVRIGDFIATLCEPAEQGKAWFLLVDAPGDPEPTLAWLDREVTTALRACGQSGATLPSNLFVLAAVGARPARLRRCWIALPTPARTTTVESGAAPALPPVGYQRHLLHWQLTGARYRRRLRTWPALGRLARRSTHSWLARWLAASVDEQLRGLWVPDDPEANLRCALAALEQVDGAMVDDNAALAGLVDRSASPC